MASSYDKIHESLMKTEAWKTLNESFRERVAKASIGEYKFTYNDYVRTDNDREKVVPRFIVDFWGPNALGPDSMEEFDFLHVSASPSELNRVVEMEFGTSSCPTYNCKKVKLLEGNKKLHKWADIAYQNLLKNNNDLRLEHQERIQKQYLEIIGGEEFARAKERHYETVVIKEIRTVVLKYYDKVGPDVLKEALDQVVTHFITES